MNFGNAINGGILNKGVAPKGDKPADATQVDATGKTVETEEDGPETPEQNVQRLGTGEANKIGDRLAAEAAGFAGVTTETKGHVYSSHPVQNFTAGPYKFEKSVLKIDSDEEAEKFEKFLATLPAQHKNQIKKVNLQVAEEIAIAHRNAGGMATKQFDSSLGRAAMERLRDGSPVVGSEALDATGFAEQGGHNENIPVSKDLIDQANGAQS